jgi:DNA-nicking Smr family endonuclease
MQIDLHGYTVHSAWHIFNDRVTDAYFAKRKTVTVITGQGAIMHEFQTWCLNHPRIKGCTRTPYNPGSFKISLKKG